MIFYVVTDWTDVTYKVCNMYGFEENFMSDFAKYNYFGKLLLEVEIALVFRGYNTYVKSLSHIPLKLIK